VDDPWEIKTTNPTTIGLVNVRTGHPVQLGLDQIAGFESGMHGTGYLRLRARVVLMDDGVHVEPRSRADRQRLLRRDEGIGQVLASLERYRVMVQRACFSDVRSRPATSTLDDDLRRASEDTREVLLKYARYLGQPWKRTVKEILEEGMLVYEQFDTAFGSHPIGRGDLLSNAGARWRGWDSRCRVFIRQEAQE